MSKISIIIPIYNVESYIKECLDSVINQTYQNLEIICVDDCGTDNSMQIVEEYAANDTRIIIAKHSKNRGLAPARNTGMDVSTGDYIFFLDSDDYISDNTIERLYAKIIETNSDVIVSKTKVFTDDKEDEFLVNRTRDTAKYLNFKPIDNYKVSIENFEEAIFKVSCVSWGKLYSKDFLIKNNLRFIDDKIIHEDNGFSLKLLAAFPDISMVNELGVMYRIRNSSIVSSVDTRATINFKIKNVKKSVEDAFKYIKKYHSKKDVKLIFKIIKDSPAYISFFNEYSFLFCNIKWRYCEKMIRILGLKIFTQNHMEENVILTKVFGIKFYTDKKFKLIKIGGYNLTRKKIYLLGFILLLKIDEFINGYGIYLFGFIKLFSVEKYRNKIKFDLFGLLPLIKISNFDNEEKTNLTKLILDFSTDSNNYNIFIKENVQKNTVLLVEPNMHYHSECLPGYVKYFNDLGYKVHLMLSNDNIRLNSFCRYKDLDCQFFGFDNYETMKTILDSDNVIEKYAMVVLTTALTDCGKLFISEIECPRKENIYQIMHSIATIEQCQIKDEKRILVLSYFDNNELKTLNPHYFGDIKITPKNNIVEFVSVGRIQSDVKNYNLLLDTVEKLIDNGYKNFKINIVGWAGDLNLDEKFRNYIGFKGKLDFEQMYKTVEDSDYMLSLLDPENEKHLLYSEDLASGSNQLVLGFKKPYLIHKVFADAYKYNEHSSIVYEDNSNLYDAMIKAMELSSEDYSQMQQRIKELADKIYDISMKNLRGELDEQLSNFDNRTSI